MMTSWSRALFRSVVRKAKFWHRIPWGSGAHLGGMCTEICLNRFEPINVKMHYVLCLHSAKILVLRLPLHPVPTGLRWMPIWLLLVCPCFCKCLILNWIPIAHFPKLTFFYPSHNLYLISLQYEKAMQLISIIGKRIGKVPQKCRMTYISYRVGWLLWLTDIARLLAGLGSRRGKDRLDLLSEEVLWY